jgi:transposase
MPWKECSVIDERLQFVARRLAGESMAELCREFGVSRKTGYKIFDRYQECGIHGLTDRSRRPYRYANQLPFQIENYILNVKQEHPSWGARKIRERLIRRFSGIPRTSSEGGEQAIQPTLVHSQPSPEDRSRGSSPYNPYRTRFEFPCRRQFYPSPEGRPHNQTASVAHRIRRSSDCLVRNVETLASRACNTNPNGSRRCSACWWPFRVWAELRAEKHCSSAQTRLARLRNLQLRHL